MSNSMPGIARLTFGIHMIVAAVIGILLLLIPVTFGGWFGYAQVPELAPPFRAFGGALLGLEALTSFYGYRSTNWEKVDYIVRGEIVHLALSTLVFLISALAGVRPAVGNWIFAIVSLVLLVLFALTWSRRPA